MKKLHHHLSSFFSLAFCFIELAATADLNILSSPNDRNCSSAADCNYHGLCQDATGNCICFSGYYTQRTNNPCAYEQKSQLTAFLLQFFLGALLHWSRSSGQGRICLLFVPVAFICCLGGCCNDDCCSAWMFGWSAQ
jgi:hypothetical protein